MEWHTLKFGKRLKYPSSGDLDENLFAERRVTGIYEVIMYIKYNNAMGIRTLALIQGGSNE